MLGLIISLNLAHDHALGFKFLIFFAQSRVHNQIFGTLLGTLLGALALCVHAIGHVPIGLTDEFIGLKNSSQSAQFWFLLGAFLLGAPPVFFNFHLSGKKCKNAHDH